MKTDFNGVSVKGTFITMSNNFNTKKKQAAQSMDKDTLNFLKEVTGKFGKPKQIDYFNENKSIHIDNQKQTITQVNT